MSLDTVGKLVASHSLSPAGSNQAKISKAEAEKVILQQMFKWMAWGFLVLGIGIVMLVTNKSFAFGKLFGLISSFIALAGSGLVAYGVLGALRDGVALTGKTPPSIPEPESTNYLPTERLPLPVPVPSVTERTTQLIPLEDVSNTRE